jgi:hypothetical protein
MAFAIPDFCIGQKSKRVSPLDDTPLTVKHKTEALPEAGFANVEVLNHRGSTYTLKAVK